MIQCASVWLHAETGAAHKQRTNRWKNVEIQVCPFVFGHLFYLNSCCSTIFIISNVRFRTPKKKIHNLQSSVANDVINTFHDLLPVNRKQDNSFNVAVSGDKTKTVRWLTDLLLGIFLLCKNCKNGTHSKYTTPYARDTDTYCSWWSCIP